MRALSIRQPYAEEILLRLKKVEYRSHCNGVRIGERCYIYAARQWPSPRELKRFCRRRWERGELAVGALVGTARISHCTRASEVTVQEILDEEHVQKM